MPRLAVIGDPITHSASPRLFGWLAGTLGLPLTCEAVRVPSGSLAAVLEEGSRQHPGSDPVATRVGAAMFTGAMAELAQQWLAGALGDDLDAVVSDALRFFR